MPLSATFWIQKLHLTPHAEGGWYREMYRAAERVPQAALPQRYAGDRNFSSSIYYLIESGRTSLLHRLKSDEIWHFYSGSPLSLHVLDERGKHTLIHLGDDPSKGQCFQSVVRAGCWFGATVDVPDSFALVGCTVSPAFDVADIEMADREILLEKFPQHRGVIELLTRE